MYMYGWQLCVRERVAEIHVHLIGVGLLAFDFMKKVVCKSGCSVKGHEYNVPYESICWREFMLAISSKIYLWRFLFWRFPSSPRVGRCPS